MSLFTRSILIKPVPFFLETELKHALSDYWFKRINDEHRIVYKLSEDAIHIAQLKYHD
jgi:Txe/YoeB family toxin of toxin-antitoxin system